jgi:hypothetical protein
MLMKKIGITTAMGLALCGALFTAGCIEQADEPANGEAAPVTEEDVSELGGSEIGITARASFFDTCLDPWSVQDGSGAFTAGGASGCRRRNGTYSVAPLWTGRCPVDLANCNGVITCTRFCP